MNPEEIFRQITAALNQAGVRYMLTDSFASNLYGTGRATQDIDLVISATSDQIRVALGYLPPTDFYYNLQEAAQAARLKSMFNILDMKSGWKIDLIFLKPDAYHQEAFLRRVPAEVEGVPVIASTAEDLILAKLDWARMGESLRQIQDVAGVLKVRKSLLDFPYIEKWVQQLGLMAQWSQAGQFADMD
ncbi:MAG TPA: hypothetical protein VGJ30_20020 [Candidatus Angelobacter sp.]